MFWKHHDQKSFVGVALITILAGAAFFAYGLVSWLANVAADQTLFVFPSMKAIGGVVVMALGYIQLELDLIRRK